MQPFYTTGEVWWSRTQSPDHLLGLNPASPYEVGDRKQVAQSPTPQFPLLSNVKGKRNLLQGPF